jgi:competence protein ComGA
MDIESFARHLLTIADAFKTSDIHVLPEQKHYGVYFRLNGQMEKQYYLDIEEGSRLISYFKFLSNMDVGERRKPQSGSYAFSLNQRELDLRFSTMTNYRAQESLVIRLLEKQDKVELMQGTFFRHELKQLQALVEYKSGLLLFSGPVDSGKTTTMYHLVKNRSKEEKQQVICIEDPVEIEEDDFLQLQVNEAANITYERLLKSSLRHHPDVLVIGEIRDEETAKMVVRGALTGHLIIASLHAKNPEGVLARLQELGVSIELLRQTIIGIAFQKLLPIYCGLCEGECQSICSHYPPFQKRSVLYEVQCGENLEKLLSGEWVDESLNHIEASREFNTLLKKVYAYGFISKKTYARYLIP